MKKLLSIFLIISVPFILTACGNKNIEGDLTDIMDKLYEGIDESNLPMMLETHEITEENFENYAFSKDIDYKEAVYSESMTGSTPHSVVLIRLNDSNDSNDVVEEIKKNANPRKWICVEAKNVYVLSKSDLVVLIMADNIADEESEGIADKIRDNFENLK